MAYTIKIESDSGVHTDGTLFKKKKGGGRTAVLSNLKDGDSFDLESGRYRYEYRAAKSGQYKIWLINGGGVVAGPKTRTAPKFFVQFDFEV